MFKKSLLALAAGGVIMFGALTGLTGAAQAGGGPSVHIGIGVPGVHYGPGYVHRRDCWLPERHLCGRPYHRRGYGRPYYPGPIYGGPVYGVPVYRGPIYGGPVYGGPVYGGPVYGGPILYFGTGRRH
jgi:hypothetical protein